MPDIDKPQPSNPVHFIHGNDDGVEKIAFVLRVDSTDPYRVDLVYFDERAGQWPVFTGSTYAEQGSYQRDSWHWPEEGADQPPILAEQPNGLVPMAAALHTDSEGQTVEGEKK